MSAYINQDNKNFLIYISKYLGVALIAGSVVHIGTLDNGFIRYIILGIIGFILMIAGNIVEARQNKQKVDLRYFFVLSVLSFATGFLSGGMQHYLDNPAYAGTLLSIGVFAAYLSFFWKDSLVLYTRNVLIVLFLALSFLFLSNFVIKDMAFDLHTKIEGSDARPHAH